MLLDRFRIARDFRCEIADGDSGGQLADRGKSRGKTPIHEHKLAGRAGH